MSRIRILLLGSLVGVVLISCTNKADDDDDDGEADGSGGWGFWTTTGPSGDTGSRPDSGDYWGTANAPDAVVTWGETALSVSISGSSSYYFGLAESMASSDPWTGEDCVYGYALSDGSVLAWCHSAGTTGTSLTYGGDPMNLSTGTTVFPSSSFDGVVGYYLEDRSTGMCWVWGDETDWWSGLGCDS